MTAVTAPTSRLHGREPKAMAPELTGAGCATRLAQALSDAGDVLGVDSVGLILQDDHDVLHVVSSRAGPH